MDYSERHYLRTMLMVRRGKISLVDDSGPVQKIQFPPSGLETRDNLYRVPEYGLASNPPEGTDAIAIFVGGDQSNGAVIGTNHQATRPLDLQAGESMLYNGLASLQVYLSKGGVIVNAGGLPVVVNNATTVTINAATKIRAVTPRFECTGDIVDNCDTTGRSMAADRQIYDGHTHAVPNVQLGGPGTTTEQPNQQE